MMNDVATQLLDIMQQITGYSAEQLRSKSRRTPLPVCRYLIFYELRLRGYTYPAIGEVLDRDHATVLYGCKIVEDGLKKNGFGPDEIEIERRFLDALEDNNMV